eukprot:3039485-Rhodomonas_salina.1
MVTSVLVALRLIAGDNWPTAGFVTLNSSSYVVPTATEDPMQTCTASVQPTLSHAPVPPCPDPSQ